MPVIAVNTRRSAETSLDSPVHYRQGFALVVALGMASAMGSPAEAKGHGGASASHGHSTQSGHGPASRSTVPLNPQASQYLYMRHAAGYDHVPIPAGAPSFRPLTPSQAYMRHVAGYDHVHGR